MATTPGTTAGVVKRITCQFGCRFLEITPSLWLCPHASYGPATGLKGSVETARALLERAGGYAAVLARVEEDEKTARDAKAEKRKHQHERVRYG